MKILILIFLLYCGLTSNAQELKYSDSTAIEIFYDFTNRVSDFITRKYANPNVYYSDYLIYSISIERSNYWRQLKIEAIHEFNEIPQQVVINNDDTLLWNMGCSYQNFITHSVIDQTNKNLVRGVGMEQVFVSCSFEDWARFYYILMIKSKKKAKLHFTVDVNTNKGGYESYKCYLKYKKRYGFIKKVFYKEYE